MRFDSKVILSHIDGFFEEQLALGYSSGEAGTDKAILVMLSSFFEDIKPETGSDVIDQFIAWKVSSRSKKKYSPFHRTRRHCDFNRFFNHCLDRKWDRTYKRPQLEKFLSEFVASYKGADRRAPIEQRNSLLSFFSFLDSQSIAFLRPGQDSPIDQSIIKKYLDEKERGFYKKRVTYNGGHASHIKCLLLRFHQYLRQLDVSSFYAPPKEEERPSCHFSEPIDRYLDFLVSGRSLSKSSVDNAKRELSRFDLFLHARKIKSLERVRITDLDEHVTAQVGPNNLKAIHRLHSTLRAFFKFLYVTNYLQKDLSIYLTAAPIYRLSEVPRHLSENEVRAILSFKHPLSKSDLRKRAIISLLIFNGLRVGEVAGLTLEDLNWEEKTILIFKRKNKNPLVSVLSDYVLAALKQYVFEARPNHRSERSLFFTECAPIRPLSPRGMTQIMRRLLRKHGISCGGAHRMRHTFGTYILESGSSLKDAQLLLGHNQINSTRIYGKSSIKRMREHVVTDEI